MTNKKYNIVKTADGYTITNTNLVFNDWAGAYIGLKSLLYKDI